MKKFLKAFVISLWNKKILDLKDIKNNTNISYYDIEIKNIKIKKINIK